MAVNITQDSQREIIADFAKTIKDGIRDAEKPDMAVIDFRDELKRSYERPIYSVKSELLRFRKENGRIAAEVATYEQLNAPLNEDDDESQKIIRDFLKESDPNKTVTLKKLIEHKGQQQPAIITADGFLINGNRRKMAIDELYKKNKDESFLWMKVVILPGEGGDNTGAPPTIKEIAQIEHRYQIQGEGKSEYTAFNRALTIRNNRDKYGISIIEQLIDDPTHHGKSDKALQGAETHLINQYIGPLDCIDEYLNYLERPKLYDSISSGKEGRWEAFFEYYKIKQLITDQKKREKYGIEEQNVGKIESACFDIIRKQEFKNLPALNLIVRGIKNSLTVEHNKRATEALVQMVDQVEELTPAERADKNGEPYKPYQIDKIWANKNSPVITMYLHLNRKFSDEEGVREGVLRLLTKALEHLSDPDMEKDINHMRYEDVGQAIVSANKITETTKIIKDKLLELRKKQEKDLKILEKKNRSKWK